MGTYVEVRPTLVAAIPITPIVMPPGWVSISDLPLKQPITEVMPEIKIAPVRRIKPWHKWRRVGRILLPPEPYSR